MLTRIVRGVEELRRFRDTPLDRVLEVELTVRAVA
jgi:hypothetical protein